MITKRDLYYFNKAKSAMQLSDFGKVKIGCIAVYKRCIIGVGYNTNKTSPIQAKYDKYRHLEHVNGCYPLHKTHAEIMVVNQIKDMDIDFSKVQIYVYREDMNGHKALCKPCNACSMALNDLGIRCINYTIKDGYMSQIQG